MNEDEQEIRNIHCEYITFKIKNSLIKELNIHSFSEFILTFYKRKRMHLCALAEKYNINLKE